MSIVYCLESPQNGSVIKFGIIIVEGWAFSTVNNIQEVQINIGNKSYNALLNIRREDVAKCHENFAQKAVNSGFRVEIKLDRNQSFTEQSLDIRISDSEEVEEIKGITLIPENMPSGNRDLSKLELFKLAFSKVKKYFKDGKFPRNLTELKYCVYKFNNIIKQKNFDIDSMNIIKDSYDIWMLKNTIDDRKRFIIKSDIENYIYKPLISIVMPAYKSDETLLVEAINSIINQLYDNWELWIVDDCTPNDIIKKVVDRYTDKRINLYRMDKNSHISIATNKGAEKSKGEFIFLMDHDDLISEDCLYEVVKVLNKNKNIDIVYSDDDKITMEGKRYSPQFKPDFSPELLLSYMYFSHIFVIRKSVFDEVKGCREGYEGSQDYDLALRLTEKTDKVYHIPKILYHWRATPNSTASSTQTKPYSIVNGLKAVEDAIIRRGLKAKAEIPEFAQKGNLGIFTLKYASDLNPKISIIIPNKNNRDILKRCIDSIISKSTYTNYEIIIVDNDSDDQLTLKYLDSLNFKIIKCSNINNEFNFSRMVNIGVENSEGDYIVLLNNDTEVISGSWLENMLVYMTIDKVGIVGSKLLYPDKIVQHAGVILKMGNGIAGHAFKLIADWDGGYLSYAKVARNYSAVTAACFMTSKKIYYEVNKFDEIDFKVSYNDVDFCLKVLEKGYRIVYSPESLLYHYEGKTRGVEQTGHFSDPREEYNLINKWDINSKFCDRYYNVNLSLNTERFDVDCKKVFSDRKKQLNILLVSHNLNYEGAPLVQFNICKNLIDKGYNFRVLSPKDGPLKADYENLGIKIIIVDFSYEKNLITKKEYFKFLDNVKEKLYGTSIDIIYSNTIETFWGVKLGEILNIPTIWGIHESVNFKTYFSTLNYDIIEEAITKFKSATKVVFVSKATEKMYKDLDTFNFATIKNGVDIDRIETFKTNFNPNKLKEQMKIPNDAVVVSIIGTVCMRKGQKIFVEAANKIIKETNKNIFFNIVGARESLYLNEIRQFISDNDINERVNIISECSDVYKYYSISDIFVCASFEESSPLVILEAMAFEIPIVSTDVFGIPELVRDKREALLTSPGDFQKLADLILVLLDNKDLRKELSYNAYYRLKTYFTIDKMIQNYSILFQEVYWEGINNVYKDYNLN